MHGLFWCPLVAHSLSKTGSGRTCIQHPSSYYGYSLYASCRIFLLRQCWKRYIWTLWACQSDLHSFHQSDSTLCWYVVLILNHIVFFFFFQIEHMNPIRRPCTPSAVGCDWILVSPCFFTLQASCGARFRCC